MPSHRQLQLSGEERAELVKLRDKGNKPYLRERASAILQVAEGQSGRQVALKGLLRPRQPDTVYEWLNRYEAEGVAGLTILSGRGRPAAYEP